MNHKGITREGGVPKESGGGGSERSGGENGGGGGAEGRVGKG